MKNTRKRAWCGLETIPKASSKYITFDFVACEEIRKILSFSLMIYNRQEFNGSLSISLCQRYTMTYWTYYFLVCTHFNLSRKIVCIFLLFMLLIYYYPWAFAQCNAKLYLVIIKISRGKYKVELKMRGEIWNQR